EAGSTIMAGTTSRLFTRPFGTSTASWRDGLIGSSSPGSGIGDDHSNGWSALRAASRTCSLIGAFCMDTAEQWEPDEARVSRPFLFWGNDVIAKWVDGLLIRGPCLTR